MNKKLNDIFEELLTLSEDLRAEVVVGELIKEQGVNATDIVVGSEGAFARAYQKDIGHVQLRDAQNHSDILYFGLNRNGIYDALPEGVFHKEVKDTSIDYTTARKLQKQEERDARRLLAPIENEAFYQRVRIENKIADIVQDFGDLNDNFLMNLWKIDKTIPKIYAIRFVKLLPYAHKIAGDLALTFQCLERILETPVVFQKQFKKKLVNMSSSVENRLGLDFVLHQEILEIQQPFLEIIVRPNSKKLVTDFLGDRGLNTFIQLFYSYFIPVEYEVDTKIEMIQEDSFILGHQDGTFMGMTTRL